MNGFTVVPAPGDREPASDAIAARLAGPVPRRAALLRGLPWTERHALARDALPVITARGDTLQYAGDREALGALATAVAVLALQPGGVSAFGWHWCADHALCEQVDAELAREGVARVG